MRSFVLSASYVVAMAVAYGTLGIFVVWSGENLQTALQTPLAVLAMSALFAALALSMFGLYELQLPQSWTARLAATVGQQGLDRRRRACSALARRSLLAPA